MSNLITVKRLDKNGHLVTRHVKGDQSPTGAGSPLPPPALPTARPTADINRMTSSEYADVVMERFREVGTGPFPSVDRMVAQLKSGRHEFKDTHEKLYDLLPELDENGVKALTFSGKVGFGGMNAPHHAVTVFAAVINSYKFARTVDDAIVEGTNPDRVAPHLLLFRANSVFGEEARLRLSDEVIGDLKSEYLLQTLGIREGHFNSRGDYYRGLTRLHEKQEEIIPYLPLLIAMHTAYDKGERDYYFGDDYYLWENIDTVMQFPKERIHAIARETVRRGEYDQGFAEEVAASKGTDVLNDGLL